MIEKELEADEVANAIRLELEYVEQMGVYTGMDREEQRRTGGKQMRSMA